MAASDVGDFAAGFQVLYEARQELLINMLGRHRESARVVNEAREPVARALVRELAVESLPFGHKR